MGRKLPVCALRELPSGGRRLVEAPGHEVLVLNAGGRCHAVQNRCPHASAALLGSGTLRGGEIVCDWHDIGFDVQTGQSDSGFELQVYPTEVDAEGLLWIELPD